MAEKFANRNSLELKHWNFNDYEDQLLEDNNVLVSDSSTCRISKI